MIAAAVLAFGFVYVHPFEDGNGRIHRYLIHHVLAQRGFNPAGVVFPVSAAILERIDEYRAVLEDYSRRLLPVIEWQPTEDGNVRVLNDTGDFYRFFDATPHAEFLYRCVKKTIDEDLPQEAEFLARYDRFRARIETMVDMPERTLDLLFRFLHQNSGALSKRARERGIFEPHPTGGCRCGSGIQGSIPASLSAGRDASRRRRASRWRMWGELGCSPIWFEDIAGIRSNQADGRSAEGMRMRSAAVCQGMRSNGFV